MKSLSRFRLGNFARVFAALKQEVSKSRKIPPGFSLKTRKAPGPPYKPYNPPAPMPKQLSARRSEQRSFPGSKLVRREVSFGFLSVVGRQGRKHDRRHVSSLGDSGEL